MRKVENKQLWYHPSRPTVKIYAILTGWIASGRKDLNGMLNTEMYEALILDGYSLTDFDWGLYGGL